MQVLGLIQFGETPGLVIVDKEKTGAAVYYNMGQPGLSGLGIQRHNYRSDSQHGQGGDDPLSSVFPQQTNVIPRSQAALQQSHGNSVHL